MFTGIITEIGTVKKRTARGLEIAASSSVVRSLGQGESVAVNGACLTVTAKSANFFSVDVMPETFTRTNFSSLTAQDVVNLELPATPQTFLSGHIVQGHVDAVGIVKEIKKDGSQFTLSISIPKQVSRYIVSKGSVAVNGVSLTVIEARSGSFSVGIIPYTWKSTTFNLLKIGVQVNIEVDVLAKYTGKLTSNKKEV